MGGNKNKPSGSNLPPPPPPPPPYPGNSDKKNYSPPTYAYSSMYSNPYGAHASHVPARFPAEVKPGVFNIWGISGFTGSVDTSTNLNSEETYCNLAKIQQSMTGYNQFDPSKFSKADTKPDTNDKDDNTSDSDSESDDDEDNNSKKNIPRPPTPPSDNKSSFTFSSYYPAHPGYGYNYGLAPPPCPPKKNKDDKKDKKKDNKCQYCAGVSGHPIKKIKKLSGKLLCWGCVWRTYTHAAQEVWEESEEVNTDGD